MSYHVKRTRTRDRTEAHAMGAPSKVGQVRYTKTFRTQRAAQREADAWMSDGDFAAEVIQGKAPRAKPNNG